MKTRVLISIGVFTLLVSGLPFASATMGQLGVTIDKAEVCDLPSNQAGYTVAGTATGYAGDKYSITVEIKDATGTVIASLTRTIIFDKPTWEIKIKGVRGGVRCRVCLTESPGFKGPKDEDCVEDDLEVTECGHSFPTLSEWVLIVLALSVGGFFVSQLMRRRKAAASV